MRNSALKVTKKIQLLFILSFVIFACKKDYPTAFKETTLAREQYDRFFNLPNNATPYLIKIVNSLKQKEIQHPFLKTLISECGFPKWEFSEIQPPKNQILNFVKTNSIRLLETPLESGKGNDSIILIPFVRDSNNYVNSFFAVKISDSLQIEVVKGKNYFNYGYDGNSKMHIAQQIALRCMTFDNKIFKTDSFRIINNNLSISFPLSKGKAVFSVRFNNTNDSLFGEKSKLSMEQEKCQTVRMSYIDCWWLDNGMICGSMPKGQCDGCWQCVSYYEYTYCSIDLGFAFSSDNSGLSVSTDGSGSGGGDVLGWAPYPRGSGGFSSTVTELSNRLGLTKNQSRWLENNPIRAIEILVYIQSSSNPLSTFISLGHIDRMRMDLNYLSFVQQYYINFSNQSAWWENPIFLAPFGGLNFGDWAIQHLNENQNIPFATFENQYLKVPEGIDGSYNSSYWDDPNLNFPKQSLPSFSDFETNYPKHSDPLYVTPSAMWNSVGGEALNLYNSNPALYKNTCALRVSKALNYSGVSITAGPDRYEGADGKYYFISCEALFKWMKKTFETPSGSNHLTGAQGGVDGKKFEGLVTGKKGIYIMIPNLPGGCVTQTGFCASGHADIINNKKCDGGCYFNAMGGVSDIYIWELQ
jgi:hypothetical protein